MCKRSLINRMLLKLTRLNLLIRQKKLRKIAQLNETLGKPEKGWTRYEDENPCFHYEGEAWQVEASGRNVSGHQAHYINQSLGAQVSQLACVSFYFYGTSIRIIDRTRNDINDYTKQMSIRIDGEEAIVSRFQPLKFMSLAYEKTNLVQGVHKVVIQALDGGRMWFDAIDLKMGSKLLPFSYNGGLIGLEAKHVAPLEAELEVYLVIEDLEEIVAEDIKLQYDHQRLVYIGCEEVEGIKLVYLEEKEGKIRLILGSKGEAYSIHAKTVLLKLLFKTISLGKAIIYIIGASVTDGIELELSLKEEDCGLLQIRILQSIEDVNLDGEFTLLDLGIDARHFGKPSDLEELAMYHTDIVENGLIDEEDLLEIGKQMLLNEYYEFNKRHCIIKKEEG